MLAAIAIVAKLLLDWFLATEIGLALRASGENPTMSTGHAIDNDRMVIVGMVLSNGLIGLAGSVFAQSQGFADVSLGIGTVVVGLAAVIIGEALLGTSAYGSRPWVVWSERCYIACSSRSHWALGPSVCRLRTSISLRPSSSPLQSARGGRGKSLSHRVEKCWVVARFRPRQVPPGR